MNSDLVDSENMGRVMFNAIHNVEMPSKMFMFISCPCQDRRTAECSLPESPNAWKLQSLRESQNRTMFGNKDSFPFCVGDEKEILPKP